MWCGVLGPLLVRRADGAQVAIGGSARRLLFGALLSRAGRAVPADVLIEDIWGQVPPRTAAKTLQSHVVRLRHDLGRDEADAVLLSDRFGYRLALGPDDLDVLQFERRLDEGLAAAERGDRETALRTLDDALALWRGDAYEGFADAPFSVPERLRLFDLRAHAEEQRTDVALDLGRAGELVPSIEQRIAAAPYRERGWEQLIIALYRAGRQADALGAYRRAAATLAEDLGIDPGPALRSLEERVLTQDPTLLAPAAPASVRVVRTATCPYLGLASYSDADSELFVGRERLTAELVGLLAEHPAVVVVGASGTGKSSVLRAGLIAALRNGALPGSAAWRAAVVTPGDSLDGAPLGELDVLVLDQAEELFTRLGTAERRSAVHRLDRFIAAGGRLVVALRGDFYGRLAELRSLAAYARAASVLVGSLRDDELRRVVVEPAQRVGLAVEDALIETVLDDVAGQPAALPMLSAALVRTWENREGETLTLDGYRRGGGVASAVEATAEDVYLGLDERQRAIARRLLVRLAAREGEAWVRRPVRRADAAPDDDSAQVLSALAAARLVTVAQERVEITHDALLAQWPRLREWLEERVLGAELLEHLDVATRAWQDAGRPASDLYRGARLQAALDWRADHPDDVSPAESEFLDAGEAAADAELVAARRQAADEARGRRRLRAVAIGLAAMVVLAAAGVAVALHERSSADRSARAARAAALSADARRLAALSLNAPDVATSSLLAAAAFRLQDSADSRGALLAAVERNASALWRVPTQHRLLRVAATPDGTRVVVLDNRGDVHVFDTATRRQLTQFPSHADLLEGMTPDGRDVFVYGAGQDQPPSGRLAEISVASGRRERVLTTRGEPQAEPAVSTDGAWLAVLTTERFGGGVAVDVFDTGDLAAAPRRFAVPAGSVAVAMGRSAVAVEHGDGSVELRQLPSLAAAGRIARTSGAPAPGSPLAVAPDGSSVAVFDQRDPRRILLFTPAGRSVVIPTQAQNVGAFAYSPDGAEIAVTSLGGAVTVYRTADGSTAEALAGHAGPVIGVAWSGLGRPSGLYTVGLDSELISWSVSNAPRLVAETGLDIAVPDRGELFGHFALGTTGSRANAPGTPDLLYRADVDAGTWSAWSIGLTPDDLVNQAVASADGRRGLVSVQDATGRTRVEIWDLVRQLRLGRLAFPPGTALRFPIGLDAAITPDGRFAYASLDARRVGVFALPSGRYLRSFTVHFRDAGAQTAVVPWQFDPRGRLVVACLDLVGGHQRLGLLEQGSDRLIAQADLGDVTSPTALAWSHDARELAVGTFDGTVSLLDADTLATRAGAGPVEPGLVHTVSFAPDDRTLVVAGTGGTLTFLSVPDLTREATGLAIGAGANNGGAFAWYARDGDVVGFAQDPARVAKPVQRWFDFRAAPRALAATACALAGGDVTRAQWTRLLGDLPYRHVCR